MTEEELASRLRAIRRTEGLTQTALAKLSGMTLQTISAHETGYRERLSVLQMFALVEACGWKVPVFIGDDFADALAERRRVLVQEMRSEDGEMDRRALAMLREAGTPRFRALSPLAVEDIRDRLAAGASQSELAREYGVTRQAIWPIAKGER